MFNKISIQWRLTILSALVLTTCCIGLTIILNYSAFLLADTIEAAVPTMPATELLPSSGAENTMEAIMPAIPLEDVQDAKRGFSSQSIMYMIVVILGGSALTYYMAAKALKPLDMLSNQVKNISVHNLAEAIAIPPTKDEIAELTQSFNEMRDKLDHAFMMQKRFSLSAAHELRTPLAVLQTKVDVFKKKDMHTGDEYEALITILQKQIGKLRGLVGDLLDMTNMSDDIEQSTICLHDVFEELMAELGDIAKDQHVDMQLRCDDSSVYGSVDLLYRAFYNLIENGIKYNVAGGHVIVEVEKLASAKTQIVIRNNGIGIPDEIKKYIFEPFYRVDASRSNEIAGSGLGLAIVDSIIKKHGGSITVFDNEMDETCFKIIV